MKTTVEIYLRRCDHVEADVLRLNPQEWRQVEYLITLLQPFFLVTLPLSSSSQPNIHLVYRFYDFVFKHLEETEHVLAPKRIQWKVRLRDGVVEAKRKLSSYYGKTYRSVGHIYAVATILDPQRKLKAFEGEDWVDEDIDTNWAHEYRETLERVFRHYAAGMTDTQTTSQLAIPTRSRLELIIDGDTHIRKRRRLQEGARSTGDQRGDSATEVDVYLSEGKWPIGSITWRVSI